MAQEECRYMEEKTEIETVIPEISDSFFQPKPHDPNH